VTSTRALNETATSLLGLLASQGKLSPSTLAEKLQVVDRTVRKLRGELLEAGLVSLVAGTRGTVEITPAGRALVAELRPDLPDPRVRTRSGTVPERSGTGGKGGRTVKDVSSSFSKSKQRLPLPQLLELAITAAVRAVLEDFVPEDPDSFRNESGTESPERSSGETRPESTATSSPRTCSPDPADVQAIVDEEIARARAAGAIRTSERGLERKIRERLAALDPEAVALEARQARQDRDERLERLRAKREADRIKEREDEEKKQREAEERERCEREKAIDAELDLYVEDLDEEERVVLDRDPRVGRVSPKLSAARARARREVLRPRIDELRSRFPHVRTQVARGGRT
jgi:hypothetical protein